MIARTIASILVLAVLSGGGVGTAQADEQAAVEPAKKSTEAWLKLVDDGKYGDSWEQASTLFKDQVTPEGWAQMVGPTRKPLGALLSRNFKSAKYATTLPGAPDGQYVVLQYDTSFANKKAAVETITPMLDKDGQWRVSGYYIK
jgi:hypothetical protein